MVRARKRSLLVGLGIASWVAACGGQVVFEGEGGSGGGAGVTTSSKATVTGPATSTKATTSTAVSSSSGLADPCLGLGCGDACVVCNDIECWQGFCDEGGVCAPDPPACAVETKCYQPGPGEPCAGQDEAGFALCSFCMGGKGCSFIGEILDGPWLAPDGCCYLVVGDCVPNP